MTHTSPGSSNPFDVTRTAESSDGHHEPTRSRRITLPLQMDDGQVKSFDLPSALEDPSTFSAGELERLKRAYAEAVGLLSPDAGISKSP
jgi:hypothetical protein